jgi:hypothetical protein
MSSALNYALYQAGWFACVLGAAAGRPWLGLGVSVALTAVHVGLVDRRRDELALVLQAAVVGLAADSLNQALGLVRFASPAPPVWLCPYWVLGMWLQFATLLRFSLSRLSGRYAATAALGLAGGPLAFLAGERLGAVELHPERWPSLVGLALLWALAAPLLVWLADRRTRAGGRPAYRWL